ncbi:MAG: hypothetical protein FD174_1419 [Geobacteraceae bacterium]|nr:MAG: hypothetical protein FD174_1419 [Geobacteraceae bacterium]
MNKIENHINQMRQFISVSKLAYDAWWTLAGESSDNYNGIRQKFPTHFQFSRYSYLTTLIVTLYMTMEKRTDTINMMNLVNLLKQEPLFKPEHIQHIEEKLDNAKLIWDKIKILRCNQFAHFNYNLSLTSVFAEANIKPNEFKQFISQLEKVINYISRIYNKSSHAFNSDHTYSTRQFMDYLLLQEKKKQMA